MIIRRHFSAARCRPEHRKRTMDNATPHGSGDYDEEVRTTIPYYETFHRETLGLVRTVRPEPEKWLDTGCGTGFLLEMATDVFPGCVFYAADPSKGMMDACKAKLAGKKNIVFLDPAGTGDLSDGRLSGADVITAIQSHHYLDREGRRAATENCFGILKRGGVFIAFENVRPATERGIRVGLDRWGAFQRDHGRSAEAVENHRERFDRKYFPVTVRDHVALLEDTGFSVVELFWYSCMQAGFYAIK